MTALDAEWIWEEEQHLNKEEKWREKGHIKVLEVDLLFYCYTRCCPLHFNRISFRISTECCDFTSLAAATTCGAFIASVLLSLKLVQV